jgi:hypothetical protein
MELRQWQVAGLQCHIFRRLVPFQEPHRSLLVPDVPSKLSSFCEHKILALFKASFRKQMEQG